jgi:hypothetical protein
MSTDLTTTGNGGGMPGLRSALMPQNFEQVLRFADMVSNSQFVPQAYRGKPGEIIAAVTYGAELGLSPMQALNAVAVINGKPAVYGDGLLAVCQSHPAWGGKEEYIEGEGDKRVAHCIVKRKGEPDAHATFSVRDAIAAGLWGKAGPWKQYDSRMLQMRARGFALRDQFADALRGIISAAEAEDYPPVGPARARDITPRTTSGPIADPAEDTAIEVVGPYGDVQWVMPVEFDAWIADALSNCPNDQALEDLAQANGDKVQEAVAVELQKRKAKRAKPHGNGHAKRNGDPATTEARALYATAKAALDDNDYEAAVAAKISAFAIAGLPDDIKGKFDDLFLAYERQVQQASEPVEQAELA